MADISLPSDKTLTELISQLDINVANTIDMNGFNLTIDCDGVDYPVSISNGGSNAKLELKNGGRIKLNATLPTNVFPYVDPEHPLPESNYDAGFTGNASAEIQLNGNFSLGGGEAHLPTDTRPGNFWAKVSGSSATNRLQFDRDFPLHPGDILQYLHYDYTGLQKVTVESYDPITRTATVTPNPSKRTVGDKWVLVAGGVCIKRLSGSATYLNARMYCGSLLLEGSAAATGTSASIVGDRVIWSPYININSSACPFTTTNGVKIIINQFIGVRLFAGTVNFRNIYTYINEIAVGSITYVSGDNFASNNKIFIKNGIYSYTGGNKVYGKHFLN